MIDNRSAGRPAFFFGTASAAGPFLLGFTIDATGEYTTLLVVATALDDPAGRAACVKGRENGKSRGLVCKCVECLGFWGDRVSLAWDLGVDACA